MKAIVRFYRFIEKYGTHIVVGVKMGGKDVIHIKQLQNSILQPMEVQKLLKQLADGKFSEDLNGCQIANPVRSSEKSKVSHILFHSVVQILFLLMYRLLY